MITQETLKAQFEYEPETGMLRCTTGRRKAYPWRGAGKQRRYLIAEICGEAIYLHRAVWLWHFGTLPAMVDHIDGNPGNNRIENLRECTPAQNQYNSARKSNNKSGYKGVAYCPMYRNPWRARIVVDKRVVLLGYFGSVEEAAKAYEAGAATYAKEFART